MMRPILSLLFGSTIRRRTEEYLEHLANAEVRESRNRATRALRVPSSVGADCLGVGSTPWEAEVALPLQEVLGAHSLITGGTGAGKTRFALLPIRAALARMPKERSFSFGILDPKGELFSGTLLLFAERLGQLEKTDPAAANELRRRLVIIDFSSRNPISPYQILAPPETVDRDFFAGTRSDLLLDLLPGGDGLSLGASGVLRKALLLLAEFHLPITWLDDLLHDEILRAKLVGQSKQDEIKAYFARQFATTPKQTIAAISRRMDALFSSQSVRTALSGVIAPDFKSLQDEGKIVLVNCFGANINRSVRGLLQALVLSDISQSVFARRNKDAPFTWFCDEAQNFFVTPTLREQMHDLLTMSRSFGTFLCFLTQNVTAAVQDSRVLRSLHTNVRWSLSLRGDPNDCAFLKPVLPISGRMSKPQTDLFKEPTFYPLASEREILVNEIANLPDRTGYFWHRTRSGEAVLLRTADLSLPSGRNAEHLLKTVLQDAKIGARVSRKEYDRQVLDRHRIWKQGFEDQSQHDVLVGSYRRQRSSP